MCARRCCRREPPVSLSVLRGTRLPNHQLQDCGLPCPPASDNARACHHALCCALHALYASCRWHGAVLPTDKARKVLPVCSAVQLFRFSSQLANTVDRVFGNDVLLLGTCQNLPERQGDNVINNTAHRPHAEYTGLDQDLAGGQLLVTVLCPGITTYGRAQHCRMALRGRRCVWRTLNKASAVCRYLVATILSQALSTAASADDILPKCPCPCAHSWPPQRCFSCSLNSTWT